METKFVNAQMNFNLDKGVEKKANDLAFETANKWCDDNPGWEYTGHWKNERNQENNEVEVSMFQVRKKLSETTDTTGGGNSNAQNGEVAPVVAQEDSKLDDSKRPVMD